MLIIVSYDISDDKRRGKLHQLLKNYGRSVQYSVFECALNEKEFKTLQKEVSKILCRHEDSIIYYPLCEKCAGKVLRTGNHRVPQQDLTIVI